MAKYKIVKAAAEPQQVRQRRRVHIVSRQVDARQATQRDPEAKVSDFVQLGKTGLRRTGGSITEEFLPQLSGSKAVEVYSEMRDNDPVVGAMLFTIRMLLRSVEWPVEPFSESPEHMDDKEFLEQCMEDMDQSWPELVAEIMSMLVYGWSFHEVVFKRRNKQNSKYPDGKIGWASMETIGQDTLWEWKFEEGTDRVVALTQMPAPTYEMITIPLAKGLHFRTESLKNNPEGRSMLRNAYRPWYFKKKIEEIEGIGIERDLAGMPTAFVPSEVLAAQEGTQEKVILDAIVDLVSNIRRDEQEGIVFPLAYDEHGNRLYDLTLMSTGGTRQFNTDAIIGRYDQRVAMSCLADFILLGHENVGSFALSSDKTDLFAVAIGSFLEIIASVINRDAIPKLFKLNGKATDELPKIKPGDLETPNLIELAQYLTLLAGIGVPLFPDEKLESFVRDVAHLPSRSEGLPTGEELQEEEREREEQMMQQQHDNAMQLGGLRMMPGPDGQTGRLPGRARTPGGDGSSNGGRPKPKRPLAQSGRPKPGKTQSGGITRPRGTV